MSNNLEDIQSVESDTRPPMLDRSDFASWQQRKFRETLAEGALHLGPERDRVVADLTPEENDRYKADICATNILLQGLPKDIYMLINHYIDAKDIWDIVKMLLEGSELTKDDRESQLYDEFEHFRQNKRETIHEYYARFTMLINDMINIKITMLKMQLNSKFVNNMLPEWGRFVTVVKLNRGLKESNYDHMYAYLKQHEAHANGNNARGAVTAGNWGVQNKVSNATPGQARQIKCYNCNGIGHMARNYTQLKRPLNLEYFKDKMLLMQAQENGVVLDEEQLLFIYLQVDQCNAFDSDVDEALIAQTMFMANLSSADPICNEAVHEIHNDVQPNYIVESDAEYTSDSNMIPYDQYVKDNIEPVVQSNVSFVPNDAYMMIINEMHEQAAQCVSANEQNKVVNASLTAELARYKEQDERYERLARFELTKREQKIDKQLRIIITDRNIKDESLKKELYSVKMQLNSTINHNKSMVEEVMTLKKDFKQKENRYLEYFLDIRALKEKVEDKLLKQDQSLQIVHMLCKPKPYHDEKKKVEIGYKSPLYLTRAKQSSAASFNGHEFMSRPTYGVLCMTQRILLILLRKLEYECLRK
ncbi:retrovirus-related pol polyprotein from transposon TNT 1-94 [Tanacetum coccineum]